MWCFLFLLYSFYLLVFLFTWGFCASVLTCLSSYKFRYIYYRIHRQPVTKFTIFSLEPFTIFYKSVLFYRVFHLFRFLILWVPINYSKLEFFTYSQSTIRWSVLSAIPYNTRLFCVGLSCATTKKFPFLLHNLTKSPHWVGQFSHIRCWSFFCYS